MAYVKLQGKIHKVPDPVAEYIFDLHQAYLSLHTRIERKQVVVGKLFEDRPCLVKPLKRIRIRRAKG